MLFCYGASGGAVTNAAELGLVPSYDGTNFANVATLRWALPVGTNAVRYATNLPADALDNARAWRLAFTNWSGATWHVSNVVWSCFP
jgi:hypothetical protein